MNKTQLEARRAARSRSRVPESVASTSDCEHVALTWSRVALEDEIIATLDSQPLGQRIAEVFARKERELGALFARLSVNDARALHRRLSLSLPDDPIALRFGRLVVERRARLVTFLADARRREAMQAGRLGAARG